MHAHSRRSEPVRLCKLGGAAAGLLEAAVASATTDRRRSSEIDGLNGQIDAMALSELLSRLGRSKIGVLRTDDCERFIGPLWL